MGGRDSLQDKIFLKSWGEQDFQRQIDEEITGSLAVKKVENNNASPSINDSLISDYEQVIKHDGGEDNHIAEEIYHQVS